MTVEAATTASLPSPTICCRVEVERVVIGYRAERQFGQNAEMGREEVMRWVAGYEHAWREGDFDAVELFSDDAHYRSSPFEESEIGHAAIKAFWLDADLWEPDDGRLSRPAL